MRHLSTDLRRRHTNLFSTRHNNNNNSNNNSNNNHNRPKQCHRHPHLPRLFYAVQNRAWNEVVRRAQSHPHETCMQEDISGNTPLHVACQLDPPPNVIRALALACKATNAEGATPLHVTASHGCSAQVIRALIDQDELVIGEEHQGMERGEEERLGQFEEEEEEEEEKNVTKDDPNSITAALTRMGRAPIHYACMSFRGLSVDAFRVLLKVTIRYWSVRVDLSEDFDDDDDTGQFSQGSYGTITNAVSMRDVTRQTPLGLLFRRYREHVRCVIKMVDTTTTAANNSSNNGGGASAAAQTVQADLGELREKERLIVGC